MKTHPIRPTDERLTVALLDTGITAGHACLSRLRLHAAQSFIAADPLNDWLGHGTTIADAFARALPPEAPPIRLIVGQVIGPRDGTGATLASGLRWAHGLGARLLIVAAGTLSCPPALARAVAEACASHRVIVAAAGNPFHGQRGPLYPAALPGVVSVGCSAFQSTYAEWWHPPDRIEQATTREGTSIAAARAAAVIVEQWARAGPAAVMLTRSSGLPPCEALRDARYASPPPPLTPPHPR